MNSFRLRVLTQVLPFLLAAPAAAFAQAVQPPTPGEAATALNPQPPLTQGQLDQILAPIALYPDQLLMQMLMAATFPQQVVDAGTWLQNPANAALNGDALVAALQPLPWDPSVKSLVAFPGVIAMMNAHLDWTQALGFAFANQQVATMAEVQALRNRAVAAKTLVTNPQITVVRQGMLIIINPTNPRTLYVPIYNPAVVYGTWPYADYPPVYIPPLPGFVGAGFNLGPGIGFSIGFGILAPLWVWGHPDWGRHTIVIDPAYYTRITTPAYINGNHIVIRGGTWRRGGPVIPIAPGSMPRSGEAGPETRPPGTVDPGGIRPGPRPGEPGGGRPGTETPTPRPGEPGSGRPGSPTPTPRPTEPGGERPATATPPPHPTPTPRPGEPGGGRPETPTPTPRPTEPGGERPATVTPTPHPTPAPRPTEPGGERPATVTPTPHPTPRPPEPGPTVRPTTPQPPPHPAEPSVVRPPPSGGEPKPPPKPAPKPTPRPKPTEEEGPPR
jgi:hypothetical protein